MRPRHPLLAGAAEIVSQVVKERLASLRHEEAEAVVAAIS